jgi:NitT/TauT family transport system substrate-binding protein
VGCCDELAVKSPPRYKARRSAVLQSLLTRGELSALGSVERRSVLKGLLGTFVGVALAPSLAACNPRARRVRLAFCSQLLCVVPYEFTRAEGFFEDEGLAVEYIYSRGGSAAMQALVGGAVDYAATSLDVALQAAASGAALRRFAITGQLPLFALATAPGSPIASLEALAGATVGISGLGNADHALLLYLLQEAGVDTASLEYATIGTTLYKALNAGQVDAGMVQEPALSLVQAAGGRVLFNGMALADAERFLGGTYEFMGVAVRAAERDERLDEMRRLARALERGLSALRTPPPGDLIAALPPELLAGGDPGRLADILERYRLSLYPETVAIDPASSARVQEANLSAEVLAAPVDLDVLLDTAVLDATSAPSGLQAA